MEYTSKAKTTMISATSKATVQIKNNFYSFSYTEERQLPDNEEVNLEKERELLWDTLNKEVDSQVEEITKLYNM